MASLRATPLFLVAPNDANKDGFYSYPDGTHSHIQWGAGFQVGVYYSIPDSWHFGLSFKSPQWFETFRFNSADELGMAPQESVTLDPPSITSAGVSYTGIERWLFACDVRYIDYRNTKGFDDNGYAPDGSVRGLGWQDQIVIALGTQYSLTDRLSLRMGYSYNNNPQHSNQSFFNLASPTIIELPHLFYAGALVEHDGCPGSVAGLRAWLRERNVGPHRPARGRHPRHQRPKQGSRRRLRHGAFTVRY